MPRKINVLLEDNKPVTVRSYSPRINYPFPQMQPGQSFFISARTLQSKVNGRSKVWSAAARFCKKNNVNDRVFKVGLEPAGVRCWRTE